MEIPKTSSDTEEDAKLYYHGEPVDVDRPYYFESDHLALKGNADYQRMLHTVCLLEAQRTKAIHDLDQLVDAQNKALKDPIEFVDKLQKGVDMNLPKPQKVVAIPNIDWDQYAVGKDLPSMYGHKHMTRHKKIQDPIRSDQSNMSNGGSQSDACDEGSNKELVRGRLKGQHKPSTFNQLWTSQEQKQLEELLVTFPPEEVEMRRWEKIAKALGNRTTHQVASRVQKYFIKLARAGLPVPGRIPNLANMPKKMGHHRHQRHNRLYWRPSTFLQSHQPPVYMSEEEDEEAGSSISGDAVMDSGTELIDEDDVPPELHNTPEYKELQRLQRLKMEKLQEDASQNVQHMGYKCDGCGCEPIIGNRWNCIDCPGDSVDFCDNCADASYETTSHSSSHRLEVVKNTTPQPYMDSDYRRFMQGDYNYLDPNYMPAT